MWLDDFLEIFNDLEIDPEEWYEEDDIDEEDYDDEDDFFEEVGLEYEDIG